MTYLARTAKTANTRRGQHSRLFSSFSFESKFLTEMYLDNPSVLESYSVTLVQPLNDQNICPYVSIQLILISRQTDHCTDEAALNTSYSAILRPNLARLGLNWTSFEPNWACLRPDWSGLFALEHKLISKKSITVKPW